MISEVRAACWAYRASRRAKTIPVGDGAATLPAAPRLPSNARRGVNAGLRLTGSSCLVRARVLQAWWLSQGEERDLIIGVTAPSKGFAAHAWLEGDPPCHSEGFAELTRQPAHQ